MQVLRQAPQSMAPWLILGCFLALLPTSLVDCATGPYIAPAQASTTPLLAQQAATTGVFPAVPGLTFASPSDPDYQIAVPRHTIWTFGTPKKVNPNVNDTGYSYLSGINQITKFWFIPYHFRYSTPTPKEVIVVPYGRPILIPSTSWTSFATRASPPAQRNFTFVRNSAIASMDNDPTVFHLTINGIKLGKGARITTNKPYNLQIPVDNHIGVTEGLAPGYLFSPFATSGFFYLVKKAKPGFYTLLFEVFNQNGVRVNNHTTTLVVGPIWK